MNNKTTNQVAQDAKTAPANVTDKTISYNAGNQEIKLSKAIVRDYLTKGDGNVTDKDLVGFINICKYNQLNPFLNEAFLVKYGNYPATMVVSKEALMKRADSDPNYDGMRGGIIVQRGNEVLELEGTFYLATDKLVGGWAEVYRKDRKYPYVAKITMAEYNSGKSLWKEKPSTMISKVAKVQALREAFPNQLGALYSQEEQGTQIEDAQFEEVKDEIKQKTGKKVLNSTVESSSVKKATQQPSNVEPSNKEEKHEELPNVFNA